MHLQLYMYCDKRKGDRTTQFTSQNQNMGDRRRHCRIDLNIVDPDEGNSWLCSACKLPIFATPFIGDGSSGTVLHDQCANLPEVLKGCELHPEKPLLLRDNHHQESCRECSEKCGSKLYYCPDSECGLILDVACALPVKVLHRSHLQHRLVGVRKSSFGTCDVCGATHEAEAEGRSYLCVSCGFWIHPKCATLSSVVEDGKHEHQLLLYYDAGTTFAADLGTELGLELGLEMGEGVWEHMIRKYQRRTAQGPRGIGRCVCAICEGSVDTRFGVYSCIKCPDYYIHIRCGTSDSRTFRAVLSGNARLPGLVRLPISDEHQSFVEYARDGGTMYAPTVTCHDGKHDFILRGNEDEDIAGGAVCEACTKVINKPPFYRCAVCPNFFFHHHCYHAPAFILSHPAHEPYHMLTLATTNGPTLDGSICPHCRCPSLQVFYQCTFCPRRFDISCTLMPGVVTHEGHTNSHFLHLSDSSSSRACHCCGRSLGQLGYECRTCPNFALHTWCAMLPKTVTHKFDPHPLRLITGGDGVAEICEICENGMNNKVWHYGCRECDQWFHIDCIPCLDLVSKIKSGGGSSKRVHSRLIRGLTLQGHGDDYCTHVADEYDILLAD